MHIKNLQKMKVLTKLFSFSLLVSVLVITFPTNIITFIHPAYAMGKPDNPGGKGGGQGQGGGNTGRNNPKAQANKNKNKNKNKNQPRVRKRQRVDNSRVYRVREFCKKNKEVCGTNRKQIIIRTDKEKRLIAIELIEAINRYRKNNNQKGR